MRKLAAIMFTDIVGYSALMSGNEKQAMQILSENRELHKKLIHQHEGEFVKEIGDGTLSIFGSAWDAVSCALDLQKAITNSGAWTIRAGIHIGDVMVSENDVFGDGVNIAARLQGICEPGRIYISESVYEDVKNKIGQDFEFIGSRSLKNISHPLKVYALSVPGSLISTHQGDEKLSKHPMAKVLNQKKTLFFLLIIIILTILFFILKPLIIKAITPGEPTPIAVISFENQTGDTAYNYLQKAIPNLLITNLEQSKLFRVMTWERMQDVLTQMGDTNVKQINANMGFEICRKEDCPIIVIGSFVKAGDVFVTDAKVLDVGTKQILESVSSRGMGVGSILESQIDDLSRSISRSLGISSFKVEQASMHILDVTTSSMEAYNYFLKGRDAMDKMYYEDARKYLEKAVGIDPHFAEAWLYLATAYNSLLNYQLRDDAIKKAYASSSKATEPEQLTIRAVYERVIMNNLDEEYRLLKMLSEKSPKDKRVRYNLGMCLRDKNEINKAIDQFNMAIALDPDYGEAYNQAAYLYAKQGNYEKALEYFNTYSRLNPRDANPVDSKGDLLWRMGRLDESISSFKKALELKPDFFYSASKIAYIYGMKEEYAKAYEWIDKNIEMSPSSGTQGLSYWARAYFDIWLGDNKQANIDLEKSRQTGISGNNPLVLQQYRLLNNIMRILPPSNILSNPQDYKDILKEQPDGSLKNISDSMTNYIITSIIYKNLNEIDSSRLQLAGLKELLSRIPNDNSNQFQNWYNYISAEIFLKEEQYTKVMDILKEPVIVSLPDFTFPGVLIYNLPFLKDGLAKAYAKLGRTSEAIEEYEKLIKFDPAQPERILIHPLYHYSLGKLYESAGRNKEASDQYRIFLKLWKNADSVYPQTSDAKARLAVLEKK